MVNKKEFVLKGNIVYATEEKKLCCTNNGYLVCCDGRSQGVFQKLPKKYENLPVIDYGEAVILPGMTDLHVHAPQDTFRGLGMDLVLLEWLQQNTFPEEAKYQELSYAREAYQMFVGDLKNSFTTRACVFATLHGEATVELMDQLEESGLVTYVGKVNMDRNGTKELCEHSAEASVEDTRKWLNEIEGKYVRTSPILTPRFIPSCSDELMRGLHIVQEEKGLRIQSHLSENPSEVAWVKELVPAADSYAGAYDLCGMFGERDCPAVMAHCVYCTDEEQKLMKERGVYVAHCPDSNINLTSGIAPIRKYMDLDIRVGLGTDVAGGCSISMARQTVLAIQMSKMYYRLVDAGCKPLNFAEAFYLATLGGGSYFGKVGSFEKDYEFDAVIVSDEKIKSMRQLSLEERVERLFYEENECQIVDKYVCGTKIL